MYFAFYLEINKIKQTEWHNLEFLYCLINKSHKKSTHRSIVDQCIHYLCNLQIYF